MEIKKQPELILLPNRRDALELEGVGKEREQHQGRMLLFSQIIHALQRDLFHSQNN